MDYCILPLNYLANHAFYNKRLQTLFEDQLDRSKATCSFKLLFNLACQTTISNRGYHGKKNERVALVTRERLFKFCCLFCVQ